MYLLKETEYFRVMNWLDRIPINTFFARAILDKKVHGKIYVDNQPSPAAGLFFHPYGMLLLCGRTDNAKFNKEVAQFMLDNQSGKTLWLQAYPDEWSRQIELLLGSKLRYYVDILTDKNNKKKTPEQLEEEISRLMNEKVIKWTRVNFTFNKQKYLARPKVVPQEGLIIRKVDQYIYDTFFGAVVPRAFWDSYDDFNKNGIGFGLMQDRITLSVCFSAFVVRKYLEIGIETNEKYRHQGCAELTCATLIDYCLENHYEPVWACRKENTGSLVLAQKLGFEITRQIPYYSLVRKYDGV
jgi:RimJ/RimL family protein N-acetyltransferase